MYYIAIILENLNVCDNYMNKLNILTIWPNFYLFFGKIDQNLMYFNTKTYMNKLNILTIWPIFIFFKDWPKFNAFQYKDFSYINDDN